MRASANLLRFDTVPHTSTPHMHCYMHLISQVTRQSTKIWSSSW